MYASHSSTPIFSAVAAVELVFRLVTTEPAGAGAVEFDVPMALAFLFVSALEQASTKIPVKIHIIKRRDFDILVLRESGWQSAQIIHHFLLCTSQILIYTDGPAPLNSP